MALLAILFATLGTWQTRRAAEKVILETEYAQAPSVSLESALANDQRFARIETHGHFDPLRHILLDNQIWQGRSGVHVFTPFSSNTGITILVNRGWLPLSLDRQSLPQIPTPRHEVTISGILNHLPVPGRMVGEADKLATDVWPQLVTYLRHADIVETLGLPLEDRIIQVSAQTEYGFEDRQWKAVFMSSERHRAYAFQWFALTTAAIVLWLLSSLRRTPGSGT